MEDSDLTSLSSLSPPPKSDDGLSDASSAFAFLNDYDPNERDLEWRSPPPVVPAKRPASPPHEFVLADNADIAFIVMFRSRFNDAFTTKLGHFGPQDIERGVEGPGPSPQVENLLCAVLALVLNRKKPIERGHYGRALEEAILAQKSQWPRAWHGQNPLSGSRTFASMSPAEKLTLLKTLMLWSLQTSETVSRIVKESYKQTRQEMDLNQPLAVQAWGADGHTWIYWLIEGQDDTSFRIYREKNRKKPGHEFYQVAGSIDELRELTQKLYAEETQPARRLADRITNAIPRFEATEEKRKRREYRVARRAQFARPEPGFSLYEGRTRGKRMRYTFEEEEDDYTSDALSTRRSTRHSGAATPAEPTVTASGRQVRPRAGGRYGEQPASGRESVDRATPLTGDYERSDRSEEPAGANGNSNNTTYYKPKGRGWKGWAIAEEANEKGDASSHIHGYNAVDAMDEDEDEALSSGESGGDWQSGDDESDVIRARDADDEDDMDDDDSDEDFGVERKSLIVTLRYGVKKAPDEASAASNASSQPAHESKAVAGYSTPSIKLEMPLGKPSDKTSTVTLPSPDAKAQSPAVLAAHNNMSSSAAAKVQGLGQTPATASAVIHPPTPPSMPSSDASAPPSGTNGAVPPPQKRQQTLDGLFTHSSAAIASGGASKSPLSNASANTPVTTT